MKTKALLTLEQFIKIGGIPYNGMELFTNPELNVTNHLNNSYYSPHSKKYSFVKLTNEGVEVKEHTSKLGTAWLYTVQEVGM